MISIFIFPSKGNTKVTKSVNKPLYIEYLTKLDQDVVCERNLPFYIFSAAVTLKWGQGH